MVSRRKIKYKVKNLKIGMRRRGSKKIENFFKACILTVSIILQLSCNEPLSKECEDFLHTPSSQIEKEFAEYNLEKQLTIHQCALSIRPPIGIYANHIAKHGKNIIPILLQKLNSDDYKNRYDAEKSKYGIILVFQRLADNGELNNNQEIIKILEQTISEIRTDWIREEAEESLTEIKKNSGMSDNY